MSARVYISHGGVEWNTVNAIAKELVGSGLRLSTWDIAGQEPLFVGSALQRIQAAEVTLVLIASGGGSVSDINRDVALSIEHGKGLLALQLDPAAEVPAAVFDAGAEVLSWSDPKDRAYLPRGVAAAERGARLLIAAAARGSGSGAPCARPTR